jgi:hypothetical protein
MDIEQLKYPIGRFTFVDAPSSNEVSGWISDIDALPGKLRFLCNELSEEDLKKQYRPDGWNIKQVVHHIADSHVNSFVRFKWTLTEDNPIIKAYDENAWSDLADYQSSIDLSLTLIESLHRRWVYLLKSLTDEQFKRTFIHPSTNKTISLSQLTGLYSWHSRHHTKHIEIALEK